MATYSDPTGRMASQLASKLEQMEQTRKKAQPVQPVQPVPPPHEAFLAASIAILKKAKPNDFVPMLQGKLDIIIRKYIEGVPHFDDELAKSLLKDPDIKFRLWALNAAVHEDALFRKEGYNVRPHNFTGWLEDVFKSARKRPSMYSPASLVFAFRPIPAWPEQPAKPAKQ